MKSKSRLCIITLSLLLLGLGVVCSIAAYTGQLPESTSATASSKVPAYHNQPPAGTLPNTLNPDEFKDPIAKVCYRRAASIKSALYQMPCYCHCDRHVGHKSLLDCFVSKHGSICDVCQKELLYVDEQLRTGSSISQIRQGITDQKWMAVDLDNYASK